MMMENEIAHTSPLAAPGRQRGGVFSRLQLVLLGFVILFEVVPRFVPIPGLTQAVLAPEYLASDVQHKFEPHPYLIMTPKPGDFTKGDGLKIHHNSAGFRGADVALEKPEGVVRIACLGGSSTYGTGPTADKFAWPARLQALLNDRGDGRSYEVMNGGVPSWNSFECLINLAFRMQPYAPDIVLIYLSTNDAECALWPEPVPDNSHYRIPWPVYRPSPIEPILEKSILYLAWRKYATDYLSQRADLGFRTKVIPGGDAGASLLQLQLHESMQSPSATGFDSFQRNLISMLALAQAHGAQPVLMTQGIVSPDPNSNDLRHGKTRLAAHARMTEIVRAVAAERGTPIVEMQRILQDAAAAQFKEIGAQTIFADSVHLTNEGTALFASALTSELQRIGVLP